MSSIVDRARHWPFIALTWLAVGCAKPPTTEQSTPEPAAAELGPVPELESTVAETEIERIKLPRPETRPEVPGFAGASSWLNVERSLSLDDLRGRIVVVDFWTSCCINCLQTLPLLERIEQRFAAEPVLVLGVHSAKFEAEKGVERLRDAVRAHAITHPVAVDAEFAIWDAWGVQAWPTIFVLDEAGRAVYADSGEPDEELLTRVIGSLLAEARPAGRLARGPLVGLRPEPAVGGGLRYPGKVLPLGDGSLAIADTGHHRLVLIDATGAATLVGSGEAGAEDGGFEQARFRDPRGMAELAGALYVADTGNHLLRRVDPTTRQVTTVAGTGELGRHYVPREAVPAGQFALRSPWAVLPWQGELVVALAGSHQIALFDPQEETLRLLAGTGRESIDDGELASASFSQPSDLASDGKEIFVLDSETSSIRAIDPRRGQVRTIVGHGLFVFGDVDGDRNKARLQHPIGLAHGRGALWVADSYNSKVKRVDPRSGVVKTVFGSGPGGELAEPAGIAWTQQGLVVADTNHHRVVRLELANGKGRVREVALGSLSPPRTVVQHARVRSEDPVVDWGELELGRTRLLRLRVKFAIPPGTKVNAESAARVTWLEQEGLQGLPPALATTGASLPRGFELTLEPAAGAERARLVGLLEIAVCDEANTVCVPLRRTLRARVRFTEGGAGPSQLELPLPAAKTN